MKKIILFLTVFNISQIGNAQNVPIFHWADHLSYKSGVSVAEGNGKVYCVTKSGIFTYNKGDNSMDRLSKINGLSDVEGVVVGFNYTDNKAIICYENSNIDILENTSITNISDIKRKNIVGDKHIYNVYFINQFAYLACGFGIVVLDMSRMEISDTYYIGPNGNPIKVYDITSDNNNIYAATEVGVYKALLGNSNLADFNSWHKIPHLPSGKYNTISAFQGKVYVNHSKFLESSGQISFQDTTKIYNPVDSSWAIFPFAGFSTYTTKQLRNCNNKLEVVFPTSVILFDSIVGSQTYSQWYFGSTPFIADAYAAAYDNSGSVWIADGINGLACWRPATGYESHYPNGPASENTFNMSCSGNSLMVAPGGFDVSWHAMGKVGEVYINKQNSWTNIAFPYHGVAGLDTAIRDVVNTLIDPLDETHGFAASWGYGIIEISNNVPIKRFDHSNSPLGGTYWTNTDGMALDANSNLWIGNSGSPKCLVKRSPSGYWSSVDFTTMIGSGGALIGQVLIDKNDQKWMMLGGKGLMVCAAGNYTTATSGNTKLLTSASGNGALPSVNVYCMAEDKNGEIWVGTDKGISVFYSPENVFVSGQNFDSQQILLEQDGHVQILLLTELVQAIAVDDANRKWIATANSGVFLMSADGTKQIYHFDESNSPLFSNDVKSIAINHKTGEVYFGTAKGIIEFRGSATESNDDCSSMYAFPNPVKPEYNGPIAIKGMNENSTVKITDVSGTLVYETASEGGQALWYGKNFKGERVSTGVYMAFCTNADGSQHCVCKILFIN